MDYDPIDMFFDPAAPVNRTERARPHWHQEGKLYFLTWRLNDSIPREQREAILNERAAWFQVNGTKHVAELSPEQKRSYFRLFNKRVHELLDAGYGSCALRDEVACRIVADALAHFDGDRYDLGSLAIAGSHVHVLALPRPGHHLSAITHSWKSFSAKRINKHLGLKGPFWRHEGYDRIVRDEEALDRIEGYILRHAKKGAYVEKRKIT